MPKTQPPAPPAEETGYAGYTSLTDYLTVHMALAGYNAASLSTALGRTRTYISTITASKGRDGRTKAPHWAPSPEMCDAIADLFSGENADEQQRAGERHIVRVLAGKEMRPADAEARGLADQIMALPADDQAFVARIVAALALSRKRK